MKNMQSNAQISKVINIVEIMAGPEPNSKKEIGIFLRKLVKTASIVHIFLPDI